MKISLQSTGRSCDGTTSDSRIYLNYINIDMKPSCFIAKIHTLQLKDNLLFVT